MAKAQELKDLMKHAKKLNKVDEVDEIDLESDYEEMKEQFMSTIEELDDDDKLGSVPKATITFYEDMVKAGKEAEEKPKKPKEKTKKEEKENLKKMDLPELEKLAKKEKVEFSTPIKKKALIKKIKASRKGKEEEQEKDSKKSSGGKKPDRFNTRGALSVSKAVSQAMAKKQGKKTTIADLATMANDLRVESGGSNNKTTTSSYIKVIIDSLEALGHCKRSGKNITVS